MLKLFANHRKSTAMLLRTCLQAVVSPNLCNERQMFRRNLTETPSYRKTERPTLPSTGNFRIWSLISHEGDSLMRLCEPDVLFERPGVKCSGSFDDKSSLISVLNSTVFPQLSHTLLLTTGAQPERKYSLSIIRGDEENEYVIIAKPWNEEKPNITDNERFIPWNHGSYSMLESKAYSDTFLG